MADCEDLMKRLVKRPLALLVKMLMLKDHGVHEHAIKGATHKMLKDHGVHEHAIKGAAHEELAEMWAEQVGRAADQRDGRRRRVEWLWLTLTLVRSEYRTL